MWVGVDVWAIVPGMPGTVTASDLRAAGLEAHFETLDEAIAEYREGGSPNVAIVTEPFGGRAALVEYVTDALGDVTHVTFPSSATMANLPDVADHDALVLTDCHALFTRRIGGFGVLDAFLESIAASDTFVLTAWNAYAWSYLTGVRNIGESFGAVVPDPELSAEGVASLLTDRYGPDLPAFVETGAAGRVKSIGFDTYRVGVPGGRSVSVPIPEPNLAYLTSWSPGRSETDVETVVFQKVALLSNGNPGIATVLWERGVTDGEIAPAYVEQLDHQPELDDQEAFVLWTILANDSRSRADLTGMFENVAVDRTLQTLAQQGIVEVSDDSVSVVPEALHAAVELLRERRLIW